MKSSRAYTVTVDPGIQTMGWCVWSGWLNRGSALCGPPIHAGQVKRIKTKRGASNNADLVKLLMEKLQEGTYGIADIVEVVVEEPAYFGGLAGQSAAVRGDLTGLALCVGAVAQWAWWMDAKLTLAPVGQWKGNMSKQVVEKRIIKHFTRLKEFKPLIAVMSEDRGHDWDACGIGLWRRGVL